MKYKSEIFEVIHQNASEIFAIGAISAAGMREFDEMCLVREPEPANSEQGKGGLTFLRGRPIMKA